MLWILGGVIIEIIILVIGGIYCDNDSLVGFLGALVLGIGIAIGLCYPAKEYTELTVVSEVELVSLNSNVASQWRGGLFYVSVSADNIYSFRYQVDNKYDLSGSAYETDTLSNNVTEIESKDCKKPVLKIYESKPIKNKWISFSLFDETIKEYVFYVPEGTIQKEIILK